MSERKVLALLTCNASLRDDYQGALRLGVERACAARDIDLWVFAGRNNWTRSADQHRLFRLIDETRVHGIVLAAGLIESFTPLEGVLAILRARCKVPMCSVGQRVDAMPSISIDNACAAGEAATHLIEAHGCRRFAYISGPAEHHESRERLRGVIAALEQHGLSLNPSNVVSGDFAVCGGHRAVAELARRGARFDALLAGNDHMALGAIEALHDSDRRCPEHVAVAGFDDAASARFGLVPLTTIRQPATQLGALAVDCIVHAWEDRRFPLVTTLRSELVLRESCGCPPAGLVVSAPADLSEAAGERALVSALGPLLEHAEPRQRWARELRRAVEDERQGLSGALEGEFSKLILELGRSQVPLHELQRVVSVLWQTTRAGAPAIEAAFHAARVRIGAMMYRRAGEQNLKNDQLVDELRLSCERLATSLEYSVLEQALATELPRLGIQNGLVAVYTDADAERLRPLLWLREGKAEKVAVDDYPAQLLLPDEAVPPSRRISLTIFPLTFESEQLGVAALELPLGSEAYAFLREQIGSNIKAAQLHEAMRVQERLHAQAREQQRVTTERLRSLNLIAGGVAHDLNNALGPLVALPEAIVASLQSATGVPDEVLVDLETIRQASLRAAHTIQDLFLLGRTDHVSKGRIDVGRLLRAEAETFRRLCERTNVEVQVHTLNQPLVIRASGPHLVRVISNLVLNAADSIEGPGWIEVRARAETLSSSVDGIERIEAGNYVVLEVADTGSGIPPELLPHILEPFFTTKKSAQRPGTGLGLAIVQRIVKDAQGFIDIHSNVGRGTTFSLYFLRQEEHAAVASHPQLAAPRGHERILVVDDEPVQLRTAERILRHLGYRVETASSGERAVELCLGSRGKGSFDLLIIDMVMPGGLDGMATVAKVRHEIAGQKVLIASGYAPDHLNEAARKRGLPWLAKPYTLSSLASAVRGTLGGAVEGTTLDNTWE
jgi:sigma-B regulation protein RsbU (phosphoserine phosphatase)